MKKLKADILAKCLSNRWCRSIGSEIIRQVAQFNPSLIVVLDQAETPLYDIELEMREKFPHIRFKFVLADVSNIHK
jgi:FlaA1/EpsC-like NDP-sugar epimerase